MLLLIHGEETFLSHKKLNQIKSKFFRKQDSNDYEELSDKEFSIRELEKKLSVIPLFGSQRIIIIKNVLSQTLANKDIDRIKELLKNIPETTIIIFYESNKINCKKEPAKTIKKLANKEWDFQKLDQKEILDWTKKEITNKKCSIEKSALDKLVSYAENNTWLLNQEIEKLTTFKEAEKITEEDIDLLVTSNVNINIFELIDSIAQKNKNKTLKSLEKLLSKGEEPIYLLGMIIYQLKNLIIIKEIKNTGINHFEISKKIKKHPFVVQKTLNQVDNFSEKELKNIYQRILETEIAIKRGLKKPSLALELLSIKLCS